MDQKTRNLSIIYAISFMDLFAIGLTFPLLSNHLRDLGVSHFTIGVLSSLYSGIQIISGPVIGSWSDVKGDRKFILTLTLLISSLSYIFLGITSSILTITLIRATLGVTKQTQSLCKVLITDCLSVEERASAYGKSAAWGSLGFIVGPILGGHLSELRHGFSYVCAITGLLFIINIALTSMIVVEENLPKLSGGLQTQFVKSLTELRDIDWRLLKVPFLIRFLFGFTITLFFSHHSVYLREQFQLNQRHVGYIISYFSATGTIAAFLIPQITHRFYSNDHNCTKRLTHFFVLMCLSLVLLSFAPDILTFLVILTPFSLSSIVLRITSMELLLKLAEKSHRGSLSGAANSIMSVAKFVTPVTSGIITDKFGGGATLFVASLPPLIGAVSAYMLKFEKSDTTSDTTKKR